MIDKMNNKIFLPALSVALLGATLAGCGQDTASQTVPTGASTITTKTAEDDHEHASGDNHAHDAQGNHVEADSAHTHDDNAHKAMMAAWFPSATITKKRFPFDADTASHLSEDSGLKFTGNEGSWEIYEAAKDGQRTGFVVMSHADAPSGKEMHINYAVDKKFIITQVRVMEAPDQVKVDSFSKQFKGKKISDAWKTGKDLKTTSGLPPVEAQTVADTVKKGLALLDLNFNAAHSHDAQNTETPHDESVPHTH